MNLFESSFPKLAALNQKQMAWILFSLIVLSGCSGAGKPVNVDVAQQTLVSTMESWKEGKTPDDLRSETPSIVVQEMEWTNGAKLLDYSIVSDDKPVDQNLIAKVKLTLSSPDGKVTEKIATYVVGTSPVLTVFRNIME